MDTLQKITIAIIEDDIIHYKLMKQKLRDENFEVIWYQNGNDFLKMEWDAPLNNIDGTPNTERDIASYKVYYEEKDFDSVSALAERINSKTPNAMIPIAGLTSGKTYYIGVIASDIDGNAHKENLATVSIKIP